MLQSVFMVNMEVTVLRVQVLLLHAPVCLHGVVLMQQNSMDNKLLTAGLLKWW
jgi:hypothetical protein